MVPWLIRHAAATINRYHVGEDGLTNYRRLNRKEYEHTIAGFGECVYVCVCVCVWYLRAKTVGHDKFENIWSDGVF